MNRGPFKQSQLAAFSLLVCMLYALFWAVEARAQDDRYWSLTPYKVEVLLSTDGPHLSSGPVADMITKRLMERISTAIGPLWDARIVLVRGAQSRVTSALASGKGDWASVDTADYDKVFAIELREGPSGVEVRGVEYDTFLQHNGPSLKSLSATLTDTPEATFSMLIRLFSPLANFDANADTPDQVSLSFKGASLPRPSGAGDWVCEGDMFLPIFRRVDRDGRPVEDGIQIVPWTYLQIVHTDTDVGEDEMTAAVHSHTPRPFGSRRRGRIQQLALRMPHHETATTLRLHSRSKPDQPLAGIEAYTRPAPGAELKRVGESDFNGLLRMPSGDERISMVYLKSGSQLVAKLPIVAGGASIIDVPLPDERARLEAESSLDAIREQLIDVVARRNILSVRINKLMSDNKLSDARQLLDELEAMPGQAQFRQSLETAKNRNRATDRMVQARIDRMFRDTELVLGAFLDPSVYRDLSVQLASAEANASATTP